MTPEDRAILNRLPADRRAVNGIPEDGEIARRERAYELVEATLTGELHPNGLRVSPLGPGWSTDIDAHVTRLPSDEELLAHGWVSLKGVLDAIGTDGAGKWAVTEGGKVLIGVDLSTDPPPDLVRGVLDRCRRERRVRLREVLELRALKRAGATIPDDPVVNIAARIENAFGGRDLGGSEDGRAEPPVSLPGAQIRRAVGGLRPKRRLVIALSGVDGSGKSTLSEALTADLRAAGLPATRVWTRPGMGLKVLDSLARWARRVTRQGSSPGIRTVAAGGEVRSRKGVVGWLWALAVTVAFLADARGRFRRAGRVVVFDRHLADALVTLDFAYEGVNLRVQRWLVRRLLPKADLTLYLEITVQEAVARKPDDVFGRHAIERQLGLYGRYLAEAERVQVFSAAGSAADLRTNALRLVTAVR